MNRLRAGLVGTADWARGVHGAGIAAHPDLDLVAVWGRDPAKAGACAAALGTTATGSFEALLEQVDVVSVAVPPDVQVPLAVQAARAGKHLLLEKPLALDRAQAEEVAGAVGESGVASVLLLTRLWAPAAQPWLDELRATGGWRGGRVEMVGALPASFLGGSPWRVAHGALWDVGPHALSLLEQVLGPVERLSAQAGADDHVLLLLRHEGGALSTAELTLTAKRAAARTDAAFWGSQGRSPSLPELGLPDAVGAHTAALADLLDQVRTGRRGGRDAAYGARLTSLLVRAEEALRR